MPSSSSSGAACCKAWPVPSCGSWRTNASPGALIRRSTSAAPWPVTTTTRADPRPAAAPRTCCNKWRPPRRVQHLRQRRAHPRPLSRRHDHDVQPHAAIRVAPGPFPVVDYRGAVAGVAARAERGCSLLKLGYSQASPLVYRWLDGYVDFDDAQATASRARARRGDGVAPAQPAARLRRAAGARRGRGAGDTTPERLCAGRRDLRRRADTVAPARRAGGRRDRPSLTPAQVATWRSTSPEERRLARRASAARPRRSGSRRWSSASSAGPRCCTASSTTPSASWSRDRSPSRR